MNITKEQVLSALSHVEDPDLKKDLVTLNMIEEIVIGNNAVKFKIVLTTPACPMKNLIQGNCVRAIHQYIGEDIDVEAELTSRVTSQRRKAEAMMAGVKNIIAVSSGKGGVGKSTIAANLAVALAKTGARVGLLDADIYGPSAPLMFGLTDAQPKAIKKDGRDMIVPVERYGVKVLSIGFFVDPEKALVWRGPMASSALTQLFTEADWGELDYVVIDMPPGTGDIHLTLVQQLPVTGVAIVSTPQEVALADARKAIDMYTTDKINVPILGLIENMSYFTPAELPNNKYYIFGREGGKRLAESANIPLLGEIPLVQSVCESGDCGRPVVLDSDSPIAMAFDRLAANVAQQIAVRNANLPPTRIVEIDPDKTH
ncbi:MAG TPA: MRP family ATP-binding protein [Bacteroidales bacterium]|nr:MAG: ATP-binding protein [Bacteroidetes bacterium GWE2_42_24]OFY30099.1 MAG: ATP-binding protein [Bacteroidetes bacterium GWF2_43_11]HAQ64856.1 MRP family ATP-binding protein [Bacteroidales bacterium]HBZ67906.1 MRP family ATP-binding protein [Bacteroidales bacterium]